MLNRKEIIETIDMVEKEHFDVRTITMGISLLSCIRDSAEETARLCYDRICKKAENIVKVAREKKANIVFFTPFARATTDRTKMYGYPEAMTAFATEQNLPIIDTTTTSFALYEKLLEKGEELVTANKATDAVSFANNIFLYLTVNDPRYIDVPEFAGSSYNKAEGTEDGTHFNVLGANVRARLAVLGLVGANNALARFENVTEADFNALCDSVIADILATEYYGKAN